MEQLGFPSAKIGKRESAVVVHLGGFSESFYAERVNPRASEVKTRRFIIDVFAKVKKFFWLLALFLDKA